MIEKIGTKGYETISTPCNEVIKLVEELKKEKENITVGEVGVGTGATSLEIFKRLGKDDIFYLFSYEEHVNELKDDLEKLNSKSVNIIAKGNTTRTYDSYNWNLAKMILEMNEKKEDGIFDLIYLDGAHTFFHDATACCCIKTLLKVGGRVVFDDMYWSFAKSPTQNPTKKPNILKDLTEEQIETCQIDMVVSIFMKSDNNFKQVFMSDKEKPGRTVWERIK